MVFHTEITSDIFQPYKKEVQKYSAGAEMVKHQNKFPILNELSLNLGFF